MYCYLKQLSLVKKARVNTSIALFTTLLKKSQQESCLLLGCLEPVCTIKYAKTRRHSVKLSMHGILIQDIKFLLGHNGYCYMCFKLMCMSKTNLCKVLFLRRAVYTKSIRSSGYRKPMAST